MNSNGERILVVIRGKDVPGITSKLTKVISKSNGVRIVDIEQTVVHGKLLLSILLAFNKGGESKSSVLKELLFAAKTLDVHLDFELFEGELDKGIDDHQYVITCLSEEIGAYEISKISTELAGQGVNIDKISRLSHGNIRCLEMLAHSVKARNPKKLSERLLPLSNSIGVDIAIQRYDLSRQAKRLVVIDMDSTLIQNEVIDEMARVSGKYKQVSKITKDVTEGKISYTQGLKKRVKLLAGLEVSTLDKVYKKVKLAHGAENFISVLKRLGFKTAIISGGFTFFTDRLKKSLKFDYAFANTLCTKSGKLTGEIEKPIVNGSEKLKLLKKIARSEGVPLDQTIAIGDGANDIDMLSKAGLGIAFQAKPIVKEKASYSISRHKGLDSILFLLGIPEREVLRLNKSR